MPDSSESCDLVAFMLEGVVTDGNPYRLAFLLCAAVVSLTALVSTASSNYSQVDKLWSIVPFVYAWIPVHDSRTLLMACITTIWGVRLTSNFARRGGYKWPPWDGDEDYRWKVIRKGGFVKILANPVVFEVFNFFFISLYQNVLLLLIAAPSFVVYTLSTSPHCEAAPLNWIDAVATILMLTLVVIETVADNQQYAFQTEKYRRKNAGEKLTGHYKDGFCQSGLFSIVRKPNYAAEQSIWICFYLFSIAASKYGAWLNWSIIGCNLLVSLFGMSGRFTETITVEKYPKYKSEYMKRVPLYVPNPFMDLAPRMKED